MKKKSASPPLPDVNLWPRHKRPRSVTGQLQNALQAANKQFDVMYYHGRNHRISGGNTDLHLHTLMTKYFLENL